MSLNSIDNLLPSTEQELINSAKNGNDYAFATLATSYKRVLDMHIRLCNPPKDMVDDLLQEGLLGLFKAVKTYDGESSSFATYASVCIRNAVLSGIRKLSNQSSNSVVDQSYKVGETSPSAEDVLLDSVRARALYETVCRALSPYEKTVFDLYLADVSLESISFVTGKSVKSISNAIYRIRIKLKRIVSGAQ